MVEPFEGSWARRPLARAICGALMAATILSACGKEDEENEPSPERGQTVARVNGQEITEHELETELKLLGPVDPDVRPSMAREVLRRMVHRTILAQKAEEAELHRTPEVMMELRRNRAETLARAFLENGLARQLPISEYDVQDFIDSHPHRFEKRKHYVFDQLLIDNDLMSDEVRNAIQNLTTLEEMEAALAELNVAFSRRINANLGSQFPQEAVAKINALEPGEIFLTKSKDYTVISELVESRLQPVSGADARDKARDLLIAQRDSAASWRIIEDLLSTSKIEFLRGFADMPIFAGDSVTSGAENGGEELVGPKAADQNAGKQPETPRSAR